MRIILSTFTTLGVCAFLLCFQTPAQAQGCVAIRGLTACGGSTVTSALLSKSEFVVGANFRYFKSFRHFRGDHEETERVEMGTEVINNSYFLDFSLNYGLTDRLYGNMILPFVHHSRSSMYEHGGNPPNGLGERHETSSSGLADARLGVGYWLFDPAKHNFNYAVGVGVKLPTGNDAYTDIFYNQGENRDMDVEAVVDQSIQPGDGGLGLTLDLQGYHAVSNTFLLSANVYYLFNPRATNGILTRNGSSEFSCPDQFAARLGFFYQPPVQGLNLYLGGRVEGVPSSDLIGSSRGYRRPGYVVSIEPGIAFAVDRFSFNLNVPVALVRNRTQSYRDKQRTIETGVYRHGDAAFADYLINLSVNYRFGGMNQHLDMPTEQFDDVTN